jgi:hypothetical protein
MSTTRAGTTYNKTPAYTTRDSSPQLWFGFTAREWYFAMLVLSTLSVFTPIGLPHDTMDLTMSIGGPVLAVFLLILGWLGGILRQKWAVDMYLVALLGVCGLACLWACWYFTTHIFSATRHFSPWLALMTFLVTFLIVALPAAQFYITRKYRKSI